MLSPFLVTQQAAAVCYRSLKKHPPLPNVPNPKCANCAGAKSAKARFEFLRAVEGWRAGAGGIGFAPSLIVRRVTAEGTSLI